MWRADSLEKTQMLGGIGGRRRRGQQRMRWWDGITDSMDMHFSRIWELVKAREAWLMQSVGSQSRTRLSDWKPAMLGSDSCFSFCFLLAVRCVRKGRGIYWLTFGRAGSSLLCTSFLCLQWAKAYFVEKESCSLSQNPLVNSLFNPSWRLSDEWMVSFLLWATHIVDIVSHCFLISNVFLICKVCVSFHSSSTEQ